MNEFNNISITDVANRLGIIIKRKKALCFAHNEKTPSLSFDDKKNVYYCHGCGIKGNVFTLVRTVLKLDNKETRHWLQNHYLGGLNPYALTIAAPYKVVKQKIIDDTSNVPNPEIYEWIINKTSLSQQAKRYLIEERGFKENTIEKLKIRDIIYPGQFLPVMRDNWGEDQLLKAGLIKLDNKGIIKCIWWDHVIIFPFIDQQERVVYLQARRMNDDGKYKYLNLKGIAKRIYNQNCLKDMKPGDRLVICEGIPDTITLIERGMRAIGILGANGFNEQDIPLLLDYSIYLLPDTDTAGASMVKKVAAAFEKYGKSIKEITLPENKKDVNEFHTANNRN